MHKMFSGPGGQAGSNGTPHLAVPIPFAIPQGGSCWIIYKDTLTSKAKFSVVFKVDKTKIRLKVLLPAAGEFF